MRAGIRLRADVELCDQIAPAQQLAAQGGARLNLDGQVHQAQHAFVGEGKAGAVLRAQEPHRPIHLVADHQDLLVEAEGRPPGRRQRGVLGHARASPLPTRRSTSTTYSTMSPKKSSTRRAGSERSILRSTTTMSGVLSVMVPAGPEPQLRGCRQRRPGKRLNPRSVVIHSLPDSMARAAR